MDNQTSSTGKIVLTANTIDELGKLQQDIIAKGWNSDGTPTQNPDGTFSVKMSKN